MRLTTFFLFIVCLHVSAAGLSQKITLSLKNVPLSRVFDEISKQAGVSVVYSDNQLAKARPVTVDIKEGSITEVLTQCLKDQPLSFRMENDMVVIQAAAFTVEVVNIDLHGHVTDSLGNPLTGANITVKGSKKGVETDAKGDFVLRDIKDNDLLIVSYTGFLPRQIQVAGQHSLHIILHPGSSPLDQVQVVAYGTQTQRFNVGSVATVTSAEIEQQPVTNPLQALQGRVAGLNIVTTNGAPGANSLVQIRGQNTLSSTTYTASPLFDQPLFIIDGVPFGPQNQNINQNFSLATKINVAMGNQSSGISPFNDINPSDIESITVLKDADATSIYGSQGSNGVILITTKKGKPGKAKLNANVYSGAYVATTSVKMMNTPQYLHMRTEALNNDGLTASNDANDPGYAPDLLLFDQHKYTNWFKYLEGGTAHNTNATLSLSGGNANDNFYLSTGYTHAGYNFPGNFADNRVSLHSSFHHQSADQRLNVEFGTDYSYDQNNSSGRPDVLETFTLPPNYPDMLDKQGNPVWNYKGFDLGGYTAYLNGVGNLLAYLKETNKLKNYDLNAHLNVGYKMGKGLNLGATFGYSKFNNYENTAFPLSSDDPSYGQQAYAEFETDNFQTIDITPQVNYDKHLLGGQLKVMVGSEYKRNITSSTDVFGQNYSNDALLGSISGASSVSAYDTYTDYRYIAVFGKIGYIWKQKYILSLTGRRDGSSNFGPGRQYGNFGSIAGGWILSEEPGIKNRLPFISYSKLSASYGSSGSDGIAPYQYQQNWQNSYYSYQNVRAYYAGNLFNPNYSWSLVRKINIGLDLGFLKDRFLVNLTVYQDKSSKQLVMANLPGQTGFTGILENFPATVQNRGWEITFTTKNIKTKHFSWNSAFNISGNVNKLVSFPGLATSPYSYIYSLGHSVNEQHVFKNAGVDPATGIFQFLGADGKLTPTPQYMTNTSQLNDENFREDATPKFIGGLSNTFTYRSFSLTVFLQGAKQKGNNYLFSVYSDWVPGVFDVNEPVQLLNVWHQPGDKAGLQKYSTVAADQSAYNAGNTFRGSSGTWGDASYIRLKTVSLSYDLKPAVIKKLGLQSANIYVNAQNLFLITGYQVGDPETQSLYSFPLQRTIVAGINLTF